MKFKKGDRFQVKKNGFTGYIVDASPDSYVVKWDHFFSSCDYECRNCDDLWDPLDDVSGGVLDHYLSVSVQKHVDSHPQCGHAWKTYSGFTEEYEYCEKCDAKRM